MHTLGYLIGGWLEGLFAGGDGVGGGPTKVLSTVLVDTEEFDSYRGDAELPGTGLGNPTNRSFIFGVEQLMRNLTLSLFSEKYFLYATRNDLRRRIMLNNPTGRRARSPLW